MVKKSVILILLFNSLAANPNVTTQVSNTSPYKNEPLLYTAFLTSKTPLYNIQTQKIEVEDAIVELVGEPRLEGRVIDGVSLNVVEFTYLITPLKPGPLTIPPITIQGAVPQKRKGSNDNLNPFALLESFGRFHPFTLTTEAIELDVQPIIPEISPWIAAKNLTLKEELSNDQTLRVGEPFSRSFLIQAEGLKSSQLPHLQDVQSSTFKIYADNPEEKENVFQGALYSMRKEQYTLIPQEAGTCILPEISITWWDSAHKEKRTSTIPARTLHILPTLETITTPISPEITAPTEKPLLLYIIIGILTFLLLTALAWGLILQKKIASLTKIPSQKPIKPAPIKTVQKEKLPDLNPT